MRLGSLIIAGLVLAPRLLAQGPAPVRGSVVSSDGGPVPYALVAIGTGAQQFTDESGWFLFTPMRPGTYQLRVRQVGFHPLDTSITVGGQAGSLQVVLRRIPVMLAALTARSERRCGGDFAQDGEALVTLFEQLRENARRARLLAEQYPFLMRVERRLAVIRPGGEEEARVDTMTLSSWVTWNYAPGRVVTPDPTMTYSSQVHLPELIHLADSVFQINHCFQLAGLRSFQGTDSLLQLDFRPIREIRTPDVEGSFFLDPYRYQIRFMRVRLTRASEAAAGVKEWIATTTFTEAMPNVPIADRFFVLTEYEANFRGNRHPDVGRSEMQRTINIDFRRAIPTQRDSNP